MDAMETARALRSLANQLDERGVVGAESASAAMRNGAAVIEQTVSALKPFAVASAEGRQAYLDDYYAAQRAIEALEPWECPIGVEGCKKNCGNYGCGN